MAGTRSHCDNLSFKKGSGRPWVIPEEPGRSQSILVSGGGWCNMLNRTELWINISLICN